VGELRNTMNSHEITQSLEDFLIYGMYPEVRAMESTVNRKIILGELMNAYLLKDILSMGNIKKPKVLTKLLALVAFQVGNEVSMSELANQLMVDMKTVEHYLDLLEKCYVLYNLRGFNRNLRSEVTKKSKYYFYDTGIRNALINNYNPLDKRTDVGALWENFMVMERIKYRAYNRIFAQEYFWRTWEKKEIDLIEESGGVLHCYEFKWSATKQPRMPAHFHETYPNSTFEVVSPENFLDYL
jgi:predicted AAA+ superfamily ATPase